MVIKYNILQLELGGFYQLTCITSRAFQVTSRELVKSRIQRGASKREAHLSREENILVDWLWNRELDQPVVPPR